MKRKEFIANMKSIKSIIKDNEVSCGNAEVCYITINEAISLKKENKKLKEQIKQLKLDNAALRLQADLEDEFIM